MGGFPRSRGAKWARDASIDHITRGGRAHLVRGLEAADGLHLGGCEGYGGEEKEDGDESTSANHGRATNNVTAWLGGRKLFDGWKTQKRFFYESVSIDDDFY